MGWSRPLIGLCVYVLVSHLALLSASSTGADKPPLRLSFRDALVRGRERHIAVLAAEERVQGAVARLSQASSALLPQVTGTALQTRQTKNLEAAGITLPGREPLVGPFNTFDARLKLTQTLFDTMAIQRLRAARIGRQLSLVESRKAAQDALALVATLYLEAKRAADGVELAHALVTRDEHGLRLAKDQYRLGLGSALQFKQAEAQLVESRHRREAAQALALERRLDLSAALGFPSSQPIQFVEGEGEKDGPVSSDEEIAMAIQQHVDVEAARQRVQQHQAERAAVRAGGLPAITANADYGASGRTPGEADATYTFGAQVSLPILEGGRRQAQAKEETSRIRESQARLDDIERHVEAKTLSASQAVKQSALLVQAREAELAVATQQHSLAKHRLITGLGSEWDVTEAFVQQASAKDRRAEAMATYQMAKVSLAHVLGRMERLIP